jgi:imidazole glycerol-phosphate synthase subunit HisH
VTGPRVAIVNYGIGNLHSAQKALEHVGAEAWLTTDPDEIDGSDAVMLPGVGAFGGCVNALDASGLRDATIRAALSGRPFLGVCVGFQMLFEGSEEAPGVAGLGLLPGMVRRLTGEVKLPQMQWNQLDATGGGPLFRGLESGWVYFVHSYAPEVTSDSLATVTYGTTMMASAGRGSVMGTQFHPEKSSRDGLRLLTNFVAMVQR